MDRLEYENNETARNKIPTDRRSTQVAGYNDAVALLNDDNVADNRRVRRIERFNEFVTFLNRRIERSEGRANRNDQTTALRRRREEL